MRNRFAIVMLISLPVFLPECRNKPLPSLVSQQEEIANIAGSYRKGKLIFAKYCNACHYAPHSQVTAEPPIFDNLFERMPEPPEEYFIKYLQDSKALKDGGDKFALQEGQLFENGYEHHFKDSFPPEDF